ncbi:isoprenoid synthase domain-containing protein [Gorgonomyces haynaldii]|nr:isoprenoid synthase domain-containing protein [Gorgonomyces haynaldii]
MSERQAFVEDYEKIHKEVIADLSNYRLPQNGIEWVDRMLRETVPGGKMNRGLTVGSSLKSILQRDLTEQEQYHAHILGWCIEMLQAFFLVADDIMDGSITRRGQPCWYKRPEVGMVAINDGFIIESVIYKLLKNHFRSHEKYLDIVELFHETTYQTELGQLMDLITAPEGDVDLSRFSIEKHAYIVEYKTAYYSFYLPIALAMLYAGISEESAFEQAKQFLLPLGEYFQVQDDFLDCYGAPEVIGKIGTDIEDNKCGWLIVQALKLASPEQRTLLDANYGQKDAEKVKIVKQIYKDLNIEQVYHDYEEESYKRLTKMVEEIKHERLPQDMFITFMNRIYKRKQ